MAASKFVGRLLFAAKEWLAFCLALLLASVVAFFVASGDLASIALSVLGYAIAVKLLVLPLLP